MNRPSDFCRKGQNKITDVPSLPDQNIQNFASATVKMLAN
jgi:hypothetical protein